MKQLFLFFILISMLDLCCVPETEKECYLISELHAYCKVPCVSCRAKLASNSRKSTNHYRCRSSQLQSNSVQQNVEVLFIGYVDKIFKVLIPQWKYCNSNVIIIYCMCLTLSACAHMLTHSRFYSCMEMPISMLSLVPLAWEQLLLLALVICHLTFLRY